MEGSSVRSRFLLTPIAPRQAANHDGPSRAEADCLTKAVRRYTV